MIGLLLLGDKERAGRGPVPLRWALQAGRVAVPYCVPIESCTSLKAGVIGGKAASEEGGSARWLTTGEVGVQVGRESDEER